MLCREAGTKNPAKILVAGAFGSYINSRDAIKIGMFPGISADLIEVVGNAAGAGAILALFDKNAAGRAAELSRITKVLDLSSHPDFQETFINSLAFPDK